MIPDFNPAWTAAWAKAQALIKDMSIIEKVNVTTGVGWEGGRCVGNTPAIPLDGSGEWKGLCLEVIKLSLTKLLYSFASANKGGFVFSIVGFTSWCP